MWRWSLLTWFLVAVVADDDSSKLVSTSQGPVRGYKDSTGEFFEFYNIPYATAPKGQIKFGPPLPPPTWLSPYDAVDEGVVCPQAGIGGFIGQDKVVTEDCLIANVVVPATEDNNLPVVVYVHGGAYQLGLGNWLNYKKLSKGKAIVITFNYRLGIHGFLCLGTKDVPGNAGLKDQVALLRWVKENIAGYGGNPNDVTIAGYSAGASSVDLIMVSKSARGLFHKVIPESGSNIAPYSIQADPLETAKNQAKVLNFTNVDDIYALEQFYVTASRETLTLDAFIDRTDSSFMFVPCVERDSGDDVFLDQSPVSIIKSGDYNKVPMLYGFTNMEGLLRIDLFELWKHKMNDNFSDFLPNDLKFESLEERDEVAKQIKEFYFGDKPVGDDNILSYIDFFSDLMFVYPPWRAVKYHLEGGHKQIYLYEYSFADENSAVIPYTETRGAQHTAQSLTVSDEGGLDVFNSTVTEDFKKIQEEMRDLWFNFITTGTPVPEGSPLPSWSAVESDGGPHMSLDRTLELRGPLLPARMQFWDQIYNKYYREPVAPLLPATGNAINWNRGPSCWIHIIFIFLFRRLGPLLYE